jgi:hypothetical protein
VTVKGTTGQVSFDVLAFDKVAAHISSGELAGGSYSNVVNWPAKAAGYDMIVRATITSAGRRTVLTQPVTPRL